MSKYTPFREWLKRQPVNEALLTFAQLEEIIGDKLPPSARKWFNSWDNTPGSPMEDSWLDAGWRTVMVDMENETVRLKRT